MEAERITSKNNRLFTHIRRLADSKSYRRQQGEFVCDGPKLLAEALQWGAAVQTVITVAGAALPALPEGVRLVEVPEALMDSISAVETSQGVLFTAAVPKQALPARLGQGRYLVLEGVQDPGNVGTILRTADAFDAAGVALLKGCADLYNPKTVRSTMGAVFRLPVWSVSLQELLPVLRLSGLPLYGAALQADTADVREMNLTACAMLVGSEGRGLSAAALAACDRTVKIPMSPRCESLNAAVAAATLLWEGWRLGAVPKERSGRDVEAKILAVADPSAPSEQSGAADAVRPLWDA